MTDPVSQTYLHPTKPSDPAGVVAAQIAPASAMKPDTLPEKFWDPQTGEIRLDDLIQSYIALEKKLSGSVTTPQTPEDKTKLHKMLGMPDSPDQYKVDVAHGLFTSDPALNEKLHQAGFTQDQVQMVYDLAAEKIVPMILELAGEFKADREVERLTAAFGGPEKWQEMSRQLLAYGRKNLPADVLSTLSSSFEGVMALYRMMKGETGTASPSPRVDPATPASEQDLRTMVRDPKYWREKDPAYVGRVTDGFKRLYSSQ